ncbi:MAG: bifunctional DNA-formamidopyrimidine glycosylase/DNA-(apurinic or apyrimidinic site) lyase [Zetaproteobacteria bacterium CG12_big_fil_rev_8_21_14_0_65_54_13]|nr:MAG: DNA-formamidopyrimidine glycosylase [Zetaproteobacteria bacterium CG23_combo_of_CG06-09_8_20_14_all_54_7]PIW49199.1 MAG: bifunctional DNA-formamidopyrimidine glycosylase/DNA-(apurinic or apyrimidinic site) lyase [Zetaproteobacteria bacterium CG12_big_fil_rev_8_21_14_0_65_54_13]PIX55466.1 MAG: bifunctional DNA-formamidopyrimidine glycosylase/DNA-(apurinic or apyrimidinic site) lyase [Zetaproteobacteria bacterium CG_4_10_14_3_um_filter_54_28]PJA29216.1 MAG: bifunctional DNA-formamidopyrimi
MPELPEVEVVRTGLEPCLVGRRIESVTCHRTGLRYPLPDMASLHGCLITAVRRRSKYLLIELSDERVLVWHLGMTGQFHVLHKDVPAGKHEHVRINLDNDTSLRYRDARRFGYAGLLAAGEQATHPWFAALGPEPLGDAFDGACLSSRCRGRKAPIKTVIMDAHVVVGVGNIYAAESLFRAGIHPARAAGAVSAARLERLATCIRAVLGEAICAGGSTISDFVRADGRPGYFAHAFQVYGRTGLPCFVCGGAIKRIQQSGRSSFYCSHCQH